MESGDAQKNVTYEGSPEVSVKPTHIPERQKIIDGLDLDRIKHPDIHYAQSPHFIVIFQDNKIYEDFDTPTLQGPEDMAYYLEGGLKIAKDLFQIEMPDTFQVVRVSRRDRNGLINGLHTYGRESPTSSSWSHARFSKTTTRKKPDSELTPAAYTTSLHEAIGHGILAPALFSKEAYFIPFLHEGLATFFDHFGSGKDAHDYLRLHMINHARDKFTDFMGEWKKISDDQLIKMINQKGRTDFSIANCFSLSSETDNILDRYDTSPNDSDYLKGGSFIKYFIDTFGVNNFKRWVGNVNRQNFIQSMEEISGLSIGEIEAGWKKSVLDNFIESQAVTDQLENVTLKDQTRNYNELRMINDLYQKYSS